MIIQDVLLINEDYCKQYSSISWNVDAKYLVPCIISSQVQDLQQLIGTQLTKALCQKVQDQTIGQAANAAYKELLDEYVQPFLLACTQAELIIANMAKIRNSGTMQYLDTNQQNLTSRDTQYFAQHYRDQAAFLGNRLTEWLKCNIANFPEYRQFCACCSGMKPDPISPAKVNIVL